MAAIQEVQEGATIRRRDAQKPAEDLLNARWSGANWMPWLFDAMVAPDADPDVKRMALEAGDKANINQIYSAGASKQQWDAFVTEYRIRQILWIRDNPTKVTGGTQRQPSASATTLAGREIGWAPQHMRGWWCTKPTFELVTGGTACADGRRQPQPE